MKALITRLRQDRAVQTLGRFYLFNGVQEVISCAALELADNGNKFQVSRIPGGTYNCELRWSQKYNWHYWVKDVRDRSLIVIHFGNYHRDTLGCILLGAGFTDLDKDGFLDVTSSKATIKKLLEVSPEKFELTIVDLDK